MSGVNAVQSAVAVVVLFAITIITSTLGRIRIRADTSIALGRGAIQMVAVALVIVWVFKHPEGVVVYLGVMLVAASVTSARRIRCGMALAPLLGLAIAAGGACAMIPVLASGALEIQSETIVPFTAQIIGGSMTAAALTGARLRDDVARDWAQVEAWLSIGATPRQAVADLGRVAAARALIPAIDQTRSAGLVTLPGAFVGLLLGGASPAEAAEVQLLVLAGLLAAETAAAALTARFLATWLGTTRPVTID